MAASDSERASNNRKSKLVDYLANGFFLLLVGSFITYCAVPHFQRQRDQRDLAVKTREECLTQFLLYANSIWREYYLVVPLVTKSHLTEQEYADQLRQLTQIKLDRYQAYAKLQALAITFRAQPKTGVLSPTRSDIEAELDKYAVEVNAISHDIDRWLRNLYCAAGDCAGDVNEEERDSYAAFERLKGRVVAFQNRAEQISETIVAHINRTSRGD